MHTHERTQSPAEPPRGFRVKGLVPRQDPSRAARWAVENLYNVVSEWPADSLLELVLAVEGKGIALQGRVNDLAPADWFDDLTYVFAPVARLRRTGGRPARLAAPVAELLPGRPDASRDEGPAFLRPELVPATLVPQHRPDPLWDLMTAMRTVPGAALRMAVSPASRVERQMAEATWRPMFAGRPAREWEAYCGTPIRTRVTLHLDAPHVPSRLLAELKLISDRLVLEPVDEHRLRALALPGVGALQGFALPKEAACALWHLPAAAVGLPVPGMKVLPASVKATPYDPPRKPADPLRVGACRDSEGRKRSVWMSPQDLGRHLRIVGSTGSGKSTAIRSLLGQWIDAGRGCLLLDPSGALCPELIGDIADPDRVVHLDFSDTETVRAFNPLRGDEEEFEARLQAFMGLIADRDSEEYTGPRWRRAFGLVARGCRRLLGDRCSLVAVFSILGDRGLLRTLAEALRPVDRPLSDQLMQELGSVQGDGSSDLWGWLVCKGEEILGSSAFSRILGSGEHSVDLTAAVDDSRVVLVNLGLAELGDRSAQLLGSMLIAELRIALLARNRRDVPFALVLDEAQLFQYGALPTLLDESRKYGLGIWACHQRPDQLRPQLRDALSANAGSYIQLRTGNPQDAAQASAMLGGWPIGDLTRLRDFRGVAVISRDGVPSEPFSIEIDFFRRHADRLADAELRDWRRSRVAAASRHSPASHPITRDTIAAELRLAQERLHRAAQEELSRPSTAVPSWLDMDLINTATITEGE